MRIHLTGLFLCACLLFIGTWAAADGVSQEPQAQPAPDVEKVEKFCIENEKDFNKYKPQLPEYFKNLPVAMGAETTKWTSDVIVVLHIGFRGEAIALNSDIWKMGKRYQDLQEVKEVCFNTKKKEMVINFTTDAEKVEVKYTDNAFVAQGVTLKKLTPDQKKDFSTHIQQKDQKSPSKQPTEETVQ